MTDIKSSASTPSRRLVLQMMAGATALAAVGGETSAEAAGATVSPATPDVTPFRVSIPQAALTDLKRRLAATRWPERETVNDWSQGVPLAKAQALIAYWRDHYDWRKFEARLNAFPQFRTQIDGLGIHFLHVKSPHPDALPILLTHGWPGSIVEFLKAIGPLTEPTKHGGRAEDAFHVVIPSLPGFGFSDKPAETGWDVVRIAKAWGVLMQRLGYTKWVAQGGDWGSGVTHALGHVCPAGLAAAHVNWPLVFPEKLPDNPTPEEKAALDAAGRFANEQYGYFKEQATRPQTIGYALADSPSGQALWIYEKFQAWTDNQGNPEDALSMDEMLDNITLYWLTDTAASSARIYWQNSQGKPSGFSAGRIELPMAATIFPHELYRAPRRWAEAMWPHLFYWGEVDKGGHFAAFEQPMLFADELRKAFRSIRQG
ncbi:epoxide hydrolase family protein [Vitiosangium sp. GDMCC 1.1324]|uniref:epoxide hydrolase family protein n=1 Tax=Vitiosangium sp. (strain GDMCC 1.1324) TaxID=2138576 RepID=UPI000D35AA82|nr:epoxide hydrolase [Vitiosangium sp. GDMCC 1.1324]PTL81075.1 epoxide hydrolase [Vitiosangium sp. GDMCC 1.1324]